MAQPLQIKASDPVNPATSFAPLTLLNHGPVSSVSATISSKQPIAATDPLLIGQHAKNVRLTLSTSTP